MSKKADTSAGSTSTRCAPCREEDLATVVTFRDAETVEILRCRGCGGLVIRVDGLGVYATPARHEEVCASLPEDVKAAYREACAVASLSPRAACALLAPHVERLCDAAGAQGADLREKLGWLRDKGLIPAELAEGLAAPGTSDDEIDKADEDAYGLLRLTNYMGNVRMPEFGKY